MAAGRNLVDSWLAAETANGEPIQLALDTLNAATGYTYRHNRISEWRSGKRPIPPAAHRHMLEHCIYQVLSAAGMPVEEVTDATWASVVDALSPPA